MYNGHADVTALINATNGAMDATYYYDAFGNIMESTGNVDNNITYAGYQYDEETGLYYLNARMYDPKIARFLQEDTYRGDPNDPLSLNLYTYVKNNPLIYYDPTGHNYIEIFGIPFGNPLEGLKILSDPQKREEAYDLIEEHGDLNFAEKRFYSLVTGYGEISAGMIKTGRDVLDSGYVQKPMLEAGRKLGFIDDDLVYEIMKEEIDDKLERNKKTLKNAPKAIYNGIIESASNVVNKENAYNFFINPDTSFNELVDYSRDTISTGLTVYSGAKMLQSGHNLLKSIRVETIPSAVTSFGQITPSTLSVTIDAGLAGNFARSAGFLGGINFATTNNKGTGNAQKINTVDDILEGANPGRVTKGRATQFEKTGGYNKALDDFNSMGVTDVKDIPGGKVGKLPDGRTINVRTGSTDGRVTLEIYDGKNSIKIRYGD
jgi:RHS repeat-associated protein